VDLIDPSTGTVLNSQTISSFTGGIYLSWAIKGQVELLVTPLAGANAVISGVFFDRFNSATYEGTDVLTHGNWIGAYGSAGYNVIGNQTSLPSYAAFSSTNTSPCVWASSTTDNRALEEAGSSSTQRIAACWYNPSGSFTVYLTFTDDQTHEVSIYAVDWDHAARSERVDVVDPSTGAVLDTRTISSFSGGVYLTWKLRGNVQLRFTPLAGPNAVVSGIFFDS
jgi:hypothetical protein